MFRLFLFAVVSAVSLFAQETSKNKGVDLPVFVITGKENIELGTAEKLPPPPLRVITEEFIKPSYDPDFLDAMIVSNPFENKLIPKEIPLRYKSKLSGSLGLITLPSIDYSTLANFSEATISAGLSADYHRPYVSYADNYSISPFFDAAYKVIQPGTFFDKQKLNFFGKYNFQSYNFITDTSGIKRDISRFDIGLRAANSDGEFWKYKTEIKTQAISLVNENIKESRTFLSGALGFSGSNFEMAPNAMISFNSESNLDGINHSAALIEANTPVKLTLSDVVSLSASFRGIVYDSIKSFKPNFGAVLKISSFLAISASFNPGYEVFDLRRELENNRYAIAFTYPLYIYSIDNRFNYSMTVESAKIFDLTFGFSTAKSDNYPYFKDAGAGKYKMQLVKTSIYKLSADLRIHPSSYGYYIANVTYNGIKNVLGQYLPNVSPINIYAVYGYTLEKGVVIKTGAKFLSRRYADIQNNVHIPYYLSIFGELGYSFSREFLLSVKIDNLLNKENYILKGYKEPRLNLELGIEFQW